MASPESIVRRRAALVNAPDLGYSERVTFQEIILALQRFWAERGCLDRPAVQLRGRRGHLQPGDLPARARARAVERRVRRAVAAARPTAATARTRTACSSSTSSRSSSSRARSTSRISTSSRCARSAPTRWSTTSASSRTTGSRPTLGAWGLGWQVWLDGLEISQFTYFQQVGGIDCRPVSRRAHLRPRAHRDVPAGQGAASTTWTYAAPARSHTASSSSAPSGSGRRTTSSRPTWPRTSPRSITARPRRSASSGVARIRREGPEGRPEASARAAGVRLRREGRAPLQRARRARRHRRHRAARFIGRVRGLAKRVAEAYVAQREMLGHPLLHAAAHR